MNEQELLHYSRQIILPEIDESGQQRLNNAKVAIVGLGGLGASASFYLAAAGVGHLVLIDHDLVELSNLQRQIIHSKDTVGEAKVDSAKQRLLNLNPYIQVTAQRQRVDKHNSGELLKDTDLILDCSDNFDTRFLLNQLSIDLKVPLVHGSAIKFHGHVTTFNLKQSSPCYYCLFDDKDQNEQNCEDQGVFPPIVGLIGTMQASEALKVILGLPTLDGTLQSLNLLNNQNKTYKISKNPSCSVCSF
ncbi:MAG: HesA/MoeB/ThiF family protein [Gammaproteobacteria bacterium]|nr:HesA/MoeB/ThiF family protein [Gammaproteobacteria bacterium]